MFKDFGQEMLSTQAAADQQPAPTQASHSSSYRIKSVEENIWHVKKPCMPFVSFFVVESVLDTGLGKKKWKEAT